MKIQHWYAFRYADVSTRIRKSSGLTCSAFSMMNMPASCKSWISLPDHSASLGRHNVAARGNLPRAAVTLDARQMYFVRTSQACDCFFRLQARQFRCRWSAVFQNRAGGFCRRIHRRRQRSCLGTRSMTSGPFLLMSIFANDRREARHFHIALMEELFEQFLILLASRDGHFIVVIQHQLNLTLAFFDHTEAADLGPTPFIVRLILPLVDARERRLYVTTTTRRTDFSTRPATT